MTSDPAVTTEAPKGTGEPLTVSAVVAAGVVLVFLFYLFISAMVPAVLLAVVLAIWGIDAATTRRTASEGRPEESARR